MKFLFFLSLIALVSGNRLAAEPERISGRRVRLLALGELPPFRQEIRDEVAYELEPPAGSIPPREVMVRFGGEKSAAIPLRLGQIGAPVKAPAGVGPLLLGRRGDADDAEPWLRLTRPESGDFLVLVWRDSKKGTWEKDVKSLVLPDDAATAPAGSVRFVNVSPAPVGILLGSEQLILEAGKMFRRAVPVGVELPFEVLLADTSGSPKRLHAGVVLQNPGERSLVLVYRADGISPRRPLKVAVQREPAPVAPKQE